MASSRRLNRLNSLLREVVSEVIHRDIRDCDRFWTASISSVEVSSDLHFAKVNVSFLKGSPQEIATLLTEMEEAAGYIASLASKKVTMRFFPHLTFQLDRAVDRFQEIDAVIQKVASERAQREGESDHGDPSV